MEIIFYTFVILFGLYASFYDIKHKIIKNYIVLILLTLGLAYNLFLVKTPNVVLYFQNIFWGIFAAVFIWYTGLWSAGDAKLFIGFNSCIPVSMLGYSSFMFFDFLINIFVPLFFISMFLLILRSRKNIIVEAIKYSFEPYRLFIIILALLGFVWFVSLPLSLFGIQQNFFVFLVILFIVMEFVERSLPFSMEVVFVAAAILRLLIDFENVYTNTFLVNFLYLIVIFVLFRYFVLYIGFYAYTTPVRFKDLKPGMHPAEAIKTTNNYEKIRLLQHSFIDSLFRKKEKFLYNPEKDLTEKDIKLLRSLRSQNKLLFEELLIHQKVPFALFLLIGFIITIFFSGNFLSFVIGVVKH